MQFQRYYSRSNVVSRDTKRRPIHKGITRLHRRDQISYRYEVNQELYSLLLLSMVYFLLMLCEIVVHEVFPKPENEVDPTGVESLDTMRQYQ